jgi:hypothetical protein
MFGVSFCILGLFTPAAGGAEISLVPVSASGSATINGNEIILDGGGQRVFLEIRISGWDPSQLRAYQATLDSSGYSSGLLGTLAPAVEPCTTDAECVAAFGTASFCDVPPFAGVECQPGFIDPSRTDYVFATAAALPAADLSTLDYRYAAGVIFTPVNDPGTAGYGGTLVLDVPVGANGTFTIDFLPFPASLLTDQNSQLISPLTLTAGVIRVDCVTAADCNDGNACTNDSCGPGGICSNVDNFDATEDCCNPANRTLIPIDDANDCTQDICDPTTGSVTHDPLPGGTICGNPQGGACDAQDTCDGLGACIDRSAPQGTACGDPNDTDCDGADTCDGSGVCRGNIEPVGAPCGDLTDTECNRADTCDGTGGCQSNIQPVGTTCGDPTDTECDDPDSCDGGGICLANAEPAGLPCGNPVGDQCDNPDTCDGSGVCQTNPVPAGTACGNPASSVCDNPDSCDGAGLCEANHLPDAALCTDDGNPCRDDVCSAGVCSHPLSPAGTPCGDPTDNACDNPDACDGAGTCLTNLEPSGAACGDPTITDCDRADTCDGVGTCQDNLEAVGVACGNPTDTDCDNPDTCDGSGICLGNVAPAGLPCGNPVGNQCDNPDTCDGTGGCEPNFVTAATACGNPAVTECDNADTCDGAGVCEANHLTDGTLCTDDGNPCRDDICSAGVCSHPLTPADTPCGDPTATNCDDPDSCDGAGTCLPNLVPAATACGDPSDTVCTVPDTCDGFGSCLPNNEADGTDCDTASFCNVGATCLAGVCGGGSPVDCDDGLPCTQDSCNEAAQRCDNDLLAGFCLIGGVCYADGGFNPGNDCQVCSVAVSTIDWATLPEGSLCDDGDPCTGTGEPGIGVDTCDATGVCLGTIDPGCNDDCIDAVQVFDGANIGNNQNRGPDDDEATCQFESDNDVWFFYIAGCTGPVSMDTIGSNFQPENDTVLTVYDACGGNEVACNDDGGPGLLSVLAFQATEGATYYIRVAGFMDNAGDIVLNISTLDSCIIDGACYFAGQVNPANECEACIPLLSSTIWSSRAAGSPCGDPSDTECDSADACDGNGVCESNHKADQEACSDDGNDCTNDVCKAGVCEHPPKSVGTVCGDPTATECDNPDTCDGAGGCRVNFAPAGLPCGDPSTTECDNADTCDGFGSCAVNHQSNGLACGDDGVECTSDVCGAGLCTHPSKSAGTPCGDANDTGCDNPDTCNGTGICLDNFESTGTACGDPTDTECDNPDACDGAGTCLLNFEPVGFTCGDPADTGCDNPDTCDGGGACRANLEPVGFPCGDAASTQCDNPDTCDGTGVCLDNFELSGLACGDPNTSECDNADICDGLGGCDANNQPDGLACGDDGETCTFDVCEVGLCTHPPRPAGTACGSASDTGCDNPDTCDGTGACLDNFEPSNTACGDPADTECDNPDTCDGTGTCLLNFEPNGFTCGDPADTGCDNPDTCNGAGLCLDNFELNGFPCGDPVATQCDDPDTCDGSGTCQSNFVSAGVACGDPSDTECDNPDSCDGDGLCGSNNEPVSTPCTGDGNECTDDVCSLGLCTHPFEPAGTACGDPGDTECDNPDTCDGIGSCRSNFEPPGLSCGNPGDTQCDNPDICDGDGLCSDNFEPDGTPCDDTEICTGNDACSGGLCAGTAIPQAPAVLSAGPRHLEVTPQPLGSVAPVALRLTSPSWACLDKYIDAAGALVPAPVIRLPDDWGTVILRSPDVVPGSQYVVVAECGAFSSAPGSASTSIWGDIVGVFDGAQWTPPNGVVNVLDMTAIVEAFQHLATAPELEHADIMPCMPDRVINILDMTGVVDGFQAISYQDSSGCTVPCP